MSFWNRILGRKSRGADERSGNDYYALYESQRPLDLDDGLGGGDSRGGFSGKVPDFASWDQRRYTIVGAVTRHETHSGPWWKPAFWRGRRKRWWALRLFIAMGLAFTVMVAWLAYTAPLSKSLEPIAAPQITLLASDGTPIARSGAMVAEPVDLAKVGTLTFEKPDETRFPATRICREAIQAGGGAPAILIAANEVAVAAFLDERVQFLQITDLVERTLEQLEAPTPGSLEDVLAIDAEARVKTQELLRTLR